MKNNEENVNIINISAVVDKDTNEKSVFGLGDDNCVYYWNVAKHSWYFW